MSSFKQSTITWIALGMAMMLIVACQPVALETGSAAGTGTETGSVTIIATPTAEAEEEMAEESTEESADAAVEEAAMISLTSVQQAIATRATDELAAELGVDASNITITAMDSVEWPDASLGCPEEGMMYASVLTSGYKIMLEADGQQYEYHSSEREDSNVVKCDPQ